MIFRGFDKNQDGKISIMELKVGLLMLGEQMSDEEVSDLVKSIDKNHNNMVDIEEFIDFLKEKDVI